VTNDDITAEVVRLIHQEMPGTQGEITSESGFEDLGMDSLTRIDLLAAVEREFGLEVPDEAVATLLRVRDLTDFLSANMVSA
jgi:acyl carrier protein